jgi:uncharacterized protein (TIGR02271 family)
MNIQRDARVYAEDGEVGRVTHVVVDPATREVTDIVVGRDGGEWLIPMGEVASVEGDRVVIEGTSAMLARHQSFYRDQYQPVDDERARDESVREAVAGGAPLLDADDDAVEIGAVGQPAAGDRRAAARGDGGPERLRLREERLNVRTEEAEAGSVRLTTRVRERVETVEAPVREEHLIIEVSPGVEGRVRFGDRWIEAGETVEILLKEERIIVEKEIVVREEVTVRTEEVQRVQRIQETVRREELVVDQRGDVTIEGEIDDAVERPPADGAQRRKRPVARAQ